MSALEGFGVLGLMAFSVGTLAAIGATIQWACNLTSKTNLNANDIANLCRDFRCLAGRIEAIEKAFSDAAQHAAEQLKGL